MSGGRFDYIQNRLNDVADDIEKIIKLNKVTIKENWDNLSESERAQLSIYDRLWTKDYFPCTIRDEAEKEANYNFSYFNQRKQWEIFVSTFINESIESHNKSYIGPEYSKLTLYKFKLAVKLIRKAAVYIQRIDWLLEGDDGEDNFHERLKEDLEKLNGNL